MEFITSKEIKSPYLKEIFSKEKISFEELYEKMQFFNENLNMFPPKSPKWGLGESLETGIENFLYDLECRTKIRIENNMRKKFRAYLCELYAQDYKNLS